ncbi:MAG: flavin reductase family protein [Hadesarchaea archaeon]|nr:flavin reductase family protein [Hadesarchaea archaeon]
MEKIDVDVSLASRLFAPRLTVLVTSIDKMGRANIITLSWAMPTSFDPPLVAISVGEQRYSHELIESCKEFVVNIPSQDILEKVQLCGSRSGRGVDKFSESGLTQLPSKKVKPPRIKECVAHLECKLIDSLRTGDHTIFIGEVLAASVDEEAFDRRGGMMKLEIFKPILHLAGHYFSTSSGIKQVSSHGGLVVGSAH